MTEGFVIEFWHLAVAAAAAIGVLTLPITRYIQIKKALIESKEAELAAHDEERDRKSDNDRRLKTLEVWRAEHTSTCTSEHKEILDAINSVERKSEKDRRYVHERINSIDSAQNEIKGSLNTLLLVMSPPHSS